MDTLPLLRRAHTSPVGYRQGALAAGEVVVIIGLTELHPVMVRVTAGTVSVTSKPIADIATDAADATAGWDEWGYGEVSAPTRWYHERLITGVRITAPAGAGCTYEVVG